MNYPVSVRYHNRFTKQISLFQEKIAVTLECKGSISTITIKSKIDSKAMCPITLNENNDLSLWDSMILLHTSEINLQRIKGDFCVEKEKSRTCKLCSCFSLLFTCLTVCTVTSILTRNPLITEPLTWRSSLGLTDPKSDETLDAMPALRHEVGTLGNWALWTEYLTGYWTGLNWIGEELSARVRANEPNDAQLPQCATFALTRTKPTCYV